MDFASDFFAFALTFLTGAAGCLALHLLGAPSTALIGSMIATGAMSATGHYPVFPIWIVSFVGNALVGTMIGKQISKDTLVRMRTLARCVIIQAVGIISLSLAAGYVLVYTTDLPVATALLSATAGGIAEMTLFAMSIDADVATIAFVQFFRIITFLFLTPYLAALARKYLPGSAPMPTETIRRVPIESFSRVDYLMLVPVAVTGAWLGRVLHIPVGEMLGAMTACSAFALLRNKKYKFTPQAAAFAQILVGLVMGSRVTPDIVSHLSQLIAPALISTAMLIVGTAILAYVLHRTQGWDYATCLLCSSPAGLIQAAFIAEETGGDPFTITVFQTVRLVGIFLFYPWFILLAVR